MHCFKPFLPLKNASCILALILLENTFLLIQSCSALMMKGHVMALNTDLVIVDMWQEFCALECSLNGSIQDEKPGEWARYDELFAAIAAYETKSPVGALVKLAVAGSPMLEVQEEEGTQEGEMLSSAVKVASKWLKENHSISIQ
ncbi:hypothetical protein [Terasakiella sp. SH-1]|uniref:hypothetical protein n=1 Tax=Terasakiella sp. SH-1 TaxID=2560057 RepID=UPI0010740E61|nr:hypothetical protein [Terasakiella sp. SH-1]